jgi:hypothetical protein
MLRRTIGLATIVLFASALECYDMQIRNVRGDTPEIDVDDELTVETVAHPFRFKESVGDPVNELIVEAVNSMGGVGLEAEAGYQKALYALGRKAAAAVKIVAAEYRDLPEDSYLDRWSLVHLLAELKHPASLQLLDDILSSAIPEEKSPDPHGLTTVGEEIMIRTTAVEALTRLAGDGNEAAAKLLLKHARHENFSVRRASIQGYLEYGGPEARQVLLKTLPRKDRSILRIRRQNVGEVPQATGGLHLVPRDQDDLPPPDLPKLGRARS